MWYSGYIPANVLSCCPQARIIYALENCARARRREKEKTQTHYFKPFITSINISWQINKECRPCLEDSCSCMVQCSVELKGHYAYPSVKPPFLFNHPLSALWVESSPGELRSWRLCIWIPLLTCLISFLKKKKKKNTHCIQSFAICFKFTLYVSFVQFMQRSWKNKPLHISNIHSLFCYCLTAM